MSEGKKKAPGAVVAATRGHAEITQTQYNTFPTVLQGGARRLTDRICLHHLRRTWRRTPRTERRRTLRILRESAVVFGCIVVAIGLPGWVEYIL